MKKKRLILFFIGLAFIIVPLFINFYHVLRLVSFIIGIILISYGLINKSKHILIKIIFIPIIVFSASYIIDYFGVCIFKTYPVISKKVESSKKMKLYNSIFYRVYDCNNVLTVDDGYKKEFVCNENTLDTVDINQFLENPKDSYKANKGKFIRVKGKITKIVGTSEITLNTYQTESVLNGYVEFDNDKMIVLKNLEIDPKDYFIYDNIEIVGMITSFSLKDDISYVELTNVKIISSGLGKTYELLVNDINNNTKTKATEGIYYVGLEGIYYKYDEENIYSIDYLLKDKRVILEDLIKDIPSTKINNDKDDLYELDKYNIVICKNKDIIFASKKVKNLEKICEKVE